MSYHRRVHRTNRRPTTVVVALAVMLLGVAPVARAHSPAATITNTRAKAQATEAAAGSSSADAPFAGLGLRFEANRGQVDPDVHYFSRGPGYMLFLTAAETVLALSRPTAEDDGSAVGDVVRVRVVGGTPGARLEAGEQVPGLTNYLIGNQPEQWVTGVPSYAEVSYRGIYPGIDLVYHGDGKGRVEYDFRVAPGTDPGIIALAFSGHRGLALDAGELVVSTSSGELRHHRPFLYQDVAGGRRAVPGSFALDGDQVRFSVGDYDRTLPLVIDPILAFSSFLGGPGTDEGNAVAVIDSGPYAGMYTAGQTCSAAFPRAEGTSPVQPAHAGACDAFVTKISLDGSRLIYSTYLGGAPEGVAVAATREPTTGTAVPETREGVSGRVGATADGGLPFGPSRELYQPRPRSGTDFASGIAVDTGGRAYITGTTFSDTFPTKSPFQGDRAGECGIEQAYGRASNRPYPGYGRDPEYTLPCPDAFVASLSADGSALRYSTYLGGTGPDRGAAITVGRAGEAYVTGQTSSGLDKPWKFDARDEERQEACKSYVSTPEVTKLENFVRTDDAGDCQVDLEAERRRVATRAFPATSNAADGTCGMDGSCDKVAASGLFDNTANHYEYRPDAFVSKLSPQGSSLEYSSFLGSDGDEIATGAALTSGGDLYVTVADMVEAGGLVTKVGAVQGGTATVPGIATVKIDGNPSAVAVGPSGDLYVTGFIAASGRSWPTGVLRYRLADRGDAFVARLDSGMKLLKTAVLGSSQPAQKIDSGTKDEKGKDVYVDVAEPPDYGTAITVDRSGQVYVTGASYGEDFPTAPAAGTIQGQWGGNGPKTPGGEHPEMCRVSFPLPPPSKPGSKNRAGVQDAGCPDAFVAKLDVNLALVYSTYLGGAPTPGKNSAVEDAAFSSVNVPVTYYDIGDHGRRNGTDEGRGIGVDSAGNAYVTGRTFSSDFPTTPNALRGIGGGDRDAFVAKIASVGVHPPLIEAITPARGSMLGGTEVRITGSRLSTATAVTFGDVPASFRFDPSGTAILAVAPRQLAGVVPVTVTGAGGASPAKPGARFTYDEGVWATTSATTTASSGQAATLLDNGKVLVVAEGDGPSRRPRLYHPTNGEWSTTDTLSAEVTAQIPRPTATLLASGKVLVVAGDHSLLYHPDTNSWTYAGKLGAVRSNQTATLLPDGRVLVAGGSMSEPSAELYDPRPGSPNRGWRPAAPLRINRHSHTATVLDDGSLLVVGGEATTPEARAASSTSAGDPVGVVEIYDPRLDVWKPGPPNQLPRYLHTATLLPGGKVLVAGGAGAGAGANTIRQPTAPAELYDPAGNAGQGAWLLAGSLAVPRRGATATLLPNGKVLVAGGSAGLGQTGESPPVIYPLTPAMDTEVFDPAMADGLGGWRPGGIRAVDLDEEASKATDEGEPPKISVTGRGTSILLSGSTAQVMADASKCGTDCGKVLFIGDGLDTPDLYTPAPSVAAVEPIQGAAAGGTRVTTVGTGMSHGGQILFDDVPGSRCDGCPQDAYAQLSRLSPALPGNRASVEMIVTNHGGWASTGSQFRYLGPPGLVRKLAATPRSQSEVDLSFEAAGSVADASPPATTYVVKQSRTPISADNFAAARSLCDDGICGGYTPETVGQRLTLAVGGLSRGVTYYYAVRARGEDGALGPMSNVAQVTLPGTPAAPPVSPPAPPSSDTSSCPSVPEPGPQQVMLPGRSYQLVAFPEGTRVDADSPLYSWIDSGSGASYSAQDGGDPVAGGVGYWAWSACDRLVTLAGPGSEAATFPLGAYNASIVGNPSGTSPALATGFDFAARWDAEADGYQVSGYREPLKLAVGEAVWVFSFEDTVVRVDASG